MFYKKIRESWKKDKKKRVVMKSSFERVERPTRLDKARGLGYRSKQGFVLVRAKMKKGRRRRPTPRKGRKPKRMGVFYTAAQSKQALLEKRTARHFPNLEVLNSYYIGQTGTHVMYEVIMVDAHHASIKSDKKINWITKDRKRVFRGRTSAAQKSRGLRK